MLKAQVNRRVYAVRLVIRALLPLLLGVGLVALVLALPALGQGQAPPALVRIDLRTPDDLARLAALDLPALAHLSTPGSDYLLALLTPQGQRRLQSLDLGWTVLDPDATDAIYYLIASGQPRLAERAAPLFTVLHDDGRQAVARLRPGVSLPAVDDLGLTLLRLGPDPIALAPRRSGAIPTQPRYDPLVVTLLAGLTDERLATYVGGLSGEWPVSIGGQPYTLATRYSYSGVPVAKATQYVYEHLGALGYAVRYHNFTLAGYSLRNVVGEKRGLVHPEGIFLLIAHLDSRAAAWPHDPAPGADDNASGSAALMVAAELLADLDLAYTVRIVFFTGEEQGSWGSYYYARDVANAGEEILGVLNLDMIAWDLKYGPDIDLHSHAPGLEDDSDALADLFAAVVDTYALDLTPQVVENGARFSDHARFWDRGYAAIMAMEDYYNASEVPAEPRDWNPNYHTAGDRLGTLNLTYFREYARASLATFVHLAGPMRTLSGTVTSAAAGTPLSATVTAAGPEGTFSDTAGLAGSYAIRLPGGTYTVTASAYGYYAQTLADVTILTGTGKRLDFSLGPIPTFSVSGTVTDAVTGLPLSATVRFDDDQIATAPGGFYSATAFSGTYLMRASAPFYYPATRTVVVDHDQRQDFALGPAPCLLVVDDDYDNQGNPYDDQAYYIAALESLGVEYDLWVVADDADGPPLEALRQYRGLVWLTGRDWDYTLTLADQLALMAYLEGGGRLFLSGQDIGWDIARAGMTPFYRDYLHARYLNDKSGFYELAGADFLSGITVTIRGGDGADNQDFPSDIAVVGDGVGAFHYTGDGDWAATAYADDTYRVVYFAFGFEGINRAADRRAVMGRVLDYLDPCVSRLPYAFTLRGGGTRFGESGQAVTHTVTIRNSGLFGDAYDLALGPFSWTTTLPITRSSPLLPQGWATVPLVVTIPPSATTGDRDQVTLTVISVSSPVHAGQVVLRTAVPHDFYLPLVLK